MSRSRRKTPRIAIIGGSHASEKQEKRKYNRKLRRRNKLELKQGKEVFTNKREIINVWSMSKDGKTRYKSPYWGTPEHWEKWMRK
jgi:hypothetical protein